MKDSDPISYDPTPDSAWEQEVASWKWTRVNLIEWRKQGNCPRCGHPISISAGVAIKSFGLRSGDVAAKLRSMGMPESIDVRCNCSVAHPPKVAASGCGQVGRIPFPWRKLVGER